MEFIFPILAAVFSGFGVHLLHIRRYRAEGQGAEFDIYKKLKAEVESLVEDRIKKNNELMAKDFEIKAKDLELQVKNRQLEASRAEIHEILKEIGACQQREKESQVQMEKLKVRVTELEGKRTHEA